MSSRRSTGVVLIVALLAWSVNQRLIACTGIPSRAAVVAPAGTSPAPKPEPSPSRHSCCPREKMHAEEAQPSSLPHCQLHAKLDASCCSMANNPAARMPFLKIARVEPQKFMILAAVPGAAIQSLRPEAVFIAFQASPFISGPSQTVLRL